MTQLYPLHLTYEELCKTLDVLERTEYHLPGIPAEASVLTSVQDKLKEVILAINEH